MSVIKANAAPKSVRPFSMTDIETAARRLLLRAQQQSEALLAEAQVEAQALRQQAATQGHAQGREQGYQQGLAAGQAAGLEQALSENRQRIDQVFSALCAATTEIEQSRHQLATQALSEVIELALSIARRVTKRQGAIDPEVLAGNLQEAMKLVVHRADLRIAIHPEQRQALDDLLPRLQLQWPALQHVQLIENPDITPGGCRVYSRQGMVDADLSSQLDRVIADLLPPPRTESPS